MSAAAVTQQGRQRARAQVRTRAMTAALGVGLIVALVAGVVTIYEAFSGKFSDKVAVEAVLPPGQPVDQGNDVEYLGAPVGTVANKGRPLAGGQVEVRLDIDPSILSALPANVTASVAPTSLFGKEDVILEAPPSPSGVVHKGEVIAASSEASESLQGTLTSLDQLLTGLHPAELDTTLSALSTALNGQAPSVTNAVREVGGFLHNVIPELPTFDNDIYLLSPLLNGLADVVPSLLTFAGNVSTTATTITQDEALLGQLLGTTTGLAGTGETLLADISTSLHATLADLFPFLQDVATANPRELPDMVADVIKVANAWAPSFTHGPALTITGDLYVENPTALLLVGTGILNPLGTTYAVTKESFGYLDPATYTSADCPRYGTDVGPNCPDGSSASSASAASTSTSPSGAPADSSAQDAATPELSAQTVPALAGAATTLDPAGTVASTPPAGSQSSLEAMMLASVLAGALH